jgi:hypothetical protein
MARRKRDLTTTTDPRFGPWKPMRGARGQAEAVEQNIGSPYRTSSPQSPLVPASGNLLQDGPSTTRRSSRWRA